MNPSVTIMLEARDTLISSDHVVTFTSTNYIVNQQIGLPVTQLSSNTHQTHSYLCFFILFSVFDDIDNKNKGLTLHTILAQDTTVGIMRLIYFSALLQTKFILMHKTFTPRFSVIIRHLNISEMSKSF